MDLTSLRTFVVAARTENFRRTAQLRFLSQATVTQQMQRLEAELGCSLFVRHGRQVRLSPAGVTFLARAERILGEVQAAASELQQAQGGHGAPLRIASAPHIARVYLPLLLARYRPGGAAPDWSLKVVSSTDVPEEVLSSAADLGLARFRPLPPTLRADLLYEDGLVLVCAHDGLDLEREPPDAAELLARQPVFTYGPSATWIAVEEALRRSGLQPGRTMHVAQVDIARQFVLQGFGIAALPADAVRADLAYGRAVAVPLPGVQLPKDGVYAVTRSEVALEFVSFARRWFARWAGNG